MEKKDYLKRLSDGVFEMEEDDVIEAANEYLEEGYPALDGIMEGLVDGMNRAGVLYEEEEYFVTDLLLCSDAMYEGLDILKPHIPLDSEEKKVRGVIGVVEGDTHDIGKNLVRIMLEAGGFDMIDLGRDVKLDEFVERAVKEEADFICMSTLMTTTMGGMERVIEILKDKNIRNNFKVFIGGGPISQKFSDQIGADGYSSNAVEAVQLVKKHVAS